MKVSTALSVLLATGATLVLAQEPQNPNAQPRPFQPQSPQPIREQLRAGGVEGKGVAKAMILRALLQNPELADSVGLGADKVEQIKEAVHAHRQSLVQSRADAEKARNEVERLQESASPNEAELMKALDEAGLKETAVRKAEAQFEIKVRQMIGPEVEAKIKARVAERMKKGMEPGAGRNEFRGGDQRGADQGRPRAPWNQERMTPPAGDGQGEPPTRGEKPPPRDG